MQQFPTVYIGWDSREVPAFEVAVKTLRANASGPVHIVPLQLQKLEHSGLMRRPRSVITSMEPSALTYIPRQQLWDVISDAPMATEFAISRFMTPLLAQSGIAIFMDCDVLVLGDVYELMHTAQKQDHLALWCVHHDHDSGPSLKMDNQAQRYYRRKNWSSVMVFNCDHPATLGLTLEMVNRKPGRDLHAFCWLHDRLIGKLEPEWNWLVNVTPKPTAPKIAHYTLGGPWLPNWETREHDDLWLSAREGSQAPAAGDHAGAGEAAV